MSKTPTSAQRRGQQILRLGLPASRNVPSPQVTDDSSSLSSPSSYPSSSISSGTTVATSRQDERDLTPKSRPCGVFMVTQGTVRGQHLRLPSFVESQAESLRAHGWEVTFGVVDDRTSLGGIVRNIRRLRRELSSSGASVVHAQYGSVTAAVAERIRGNRPLIVSFCGSDLLGSPPPGWGWWLRAKVAREVGLWAARRAVAIIVKSRNLLESLPESLEARAALLPNGVDLEFFTPVPMAEARAQLGWREERVILFNCTRSIQHWSKNLPLAESAVTALQSQMNNVRLEIFTGQSRDRVRLMLNGADCLLLTSLHEGSPNLVKEAMACNLPVVSVPCGDVAERLAGVRPGRIVPYDAQHVAAALEDVFAASSRSNGREQLERQGLSTDVIAHRLARIYRDVIDEERGEASAPAVGTSPRDLDGRLEHPRECRRSRRLLMVGNFLSVAGRHGTSQCLANELRRMGFEVMTTSGVLRRIPRLVDMLKTAIRRRHEYDLAHVEVFSGPAFIWAEAVCLALRALRKPYVLTLRGGNLPAFAKRFPGRVRRLLRTAAAVTAPSPYLCGELKQYRPDLLLIPNGLDVRTYRPLALTAARPKLIWLRAFHSIYNPVLAPRVMFELLRDVPDASLTMIGPDKGDGAFQAVQREAVKLGVAECMKFPGAVPKSEVSSRMSEADIFINTTDIDNTPVSVLEAMATGLCVVSTNVGGIPYLLEDGKDALLVPPNDPIAMADAIRRVLSDPALARTLSRNAREKAEQFDWTQVTSKWDGLLSAVTGSQ